jgi:hypothetical protein
LAAFAKNLGRPPVVVDLTQLRPVVDDIRHARKRLVRWMPPPR